MEPVYILGISAFYHDSAACLIRDGEIIAAAQEERFTRKKHDHRFPKHAVQYCLDYAGIPVTQIQHVAFYDKPWIKFERLLETYLAFAPAGLPSFMKAMPLWLKEKLWMGDLVKDELGFAGELIYPEHHQSHAASAFFPSPFQSAAIITMDGVGEWATTSYGVGRGNKIDLQYELRFPHSLGLLYSAFTYYTGFKVNSGEYKVMGLAPYGTPKYTKLIYDNLIDLKDDGSFRLNMEYFNYCQGLTMTSDKFHALFGGPPREAESTLTQKEMDLACSVQDVTEEIMLRMARHVRKETGEKNLCLAGGVALNCVGNGKILREGIFERIWIQPAAGDAGGSMGAALLTWHELLDHPRIAASGDHMQGGYLGPQTPTDEVEAYLQSIQAPYAALSDTDLADQVAEKAAQGLVIGFFYGRMEFGPRPLGFPPKDFRIITWRRTRRKSLETAFSCVTWASTTEASAAAAGRVAASSTRPAAVSGVGISLGIPLRTRSRVALSLAEAASLKAATADGAVPIRGDAWGLALAAPGLKRAAGVAGGVARSRVVRSAQRLCSRESPCPAARVAADCIAAAAPLVGARGRGGAHTGVARRLRWLPRRRRAPASRLACPNDAHRRLRPALIALAAVSRCAPACNVPPHRTRHVPRAVPPPRRPIASSSEYAAPAAAISEAISCATAPPRHLHAPASAGAAAAHATTTPSSPSNTLQPPGHSATSRRRSSQPPAAARPADACAVPALRARRRLPHRVRRRTAPPPLLGARTRPPRRTGRPGCGGVRLWRPL